MERFGPAPDQGLAGPQVQSSTVCMYAPLLGIAECEDRGSGTGFKQPSKSVLIDHKFEGQEGLTCESAQLCRTQPPKFASSDDQTG